MEKEMGPKPERITRTKDLTADNWLEQDETLDAFRRLTPKGVLPLTADDLARGFLSVDLSPLVPGEVQVLFRTARGVLPYGSFFYPLFALGQEQLTRVGEAAIGEKYRNLDGPRKKRNMKDRLEWLEDSHYLDEKEAFWWHRMRNLRNHSSHAEMQMLMTPGETRGFLYQTAHAIGCLFDESLDFMSLRSTEPHVEEH